MLLLEPLSISAAAESLMYMQKDVYKASYKDMSWQYQVLNTLMLIDLYRYIEELAVSLLVCTDLKYALHGRSDILGHVC